MVVTACETIARHKRENKSKNLFIYLSVKVVDSYAAPEGRVFKIEISKVSGSALAAEICTGPHNRLLRRQHCSSLCSQSEGHEHIANMTKALEHDFVGFSVANSIIPITAELHAYLSLSLAPKVYGFIALEHHMIAEQSC